MKKSYKCCEFCQKRVKSKYTHYQENADCKLAAKNQLREDELKLRNWTGEATVKCKICGYSAKELTRHLKTEHQIAAKEYKEKYGQIISDYEKLKKSIFWRKRNAGNNNPMYGKKPWNTDFNRKDEVTKKLGATWRGKKLSKQHKEKLAYAKTGITGENANAYGPHNVSEEGRRKMREGAFRGKLAINKHSKGEIELGIYLYELYEDCEWNYQLDFYQCDYCIPSKKIIVEYDGDWYHAGTHYGEAKSPIQKAVYKNDIKKTGHILSKGYKLVRILESEYQEHKKRGDLKRWLNALLA